MRTVVLTELRRVLQQHTSTYTKEIPRPKTLNSTQTCFGAISPINNSQLPFLYIHDIHTERANIADEEQKKKKLYVWIKSTSCHSECSSSVRWSLLLLLSYSFSPANRALTLPPSLLTHPSRFLPRFSVHCYSFSLPNSRVLPTSALFTHFFWLCSVDRLLLILSCPFLLLCFYTSLVVFVVVVLCFK